MSDIRGFELAARTRKAVLWLSIDANHDARGLDHPVSAPTGGKPELLDRIVDDDGDDGESGRDQRVALARAPSRRADLLLLDEPFSALDAPLRASLGEQLLSLQREFSGTTIMVTHDPLEAALLADELLILEGRRSAGWAYCRGV